MKELIKGLIPKQLKPLARKIYSLISGNGSAPNLSPEQYEALGALKCIVSYNRYGGYCVPESSRNRPAARKVLANDVYEPDTIAFIRQHCDQGDVVHAGTYFGDFLPGLASGVAPGAMVWAFEPNPENYRCARITLELNDAGNVTLTNAGLGAKRDTLLVQTSDDQGRSLGGSSKIIAGESTDTGGTESVEIVTIDDMVGPDRQVSIIQLDVEGHEQEALSGALKTIGRCRPIIILEVLPESSLLESDWFADTILDLGYRETGRLHGNTVFSCVEKTGE